MKTSTANYARVARELLALKDEYKADFLKGFFKTGKGQYAEGDIFLGLTVPSTRSVVKKYWKEISLPDVAKLLKNKFHEFRLAALHILVEKYRAADDHPTRKKIFALYTAHTKYINNWDLVDTSAAPIVGAYLSDEMEHDERLRFINRYIKSKDLWENRIIVVATHYQIKKGNEKMLFFVARALMQHPHDLMHKAIGWMLREVGKQNRATLTAFLKQHAHEMPRTMLRYALEHYGAKERAHFMKAKSLKAME